MMMANEDGLFQSIINQEIADSLDSGNMSQEAMPENVGIDVAGVRVPKFMSNMLGRGGARQMPAPEENVQPEIPTVTKPEIPTLTKGNMGYTVRPEAVKQDMSMESIDPLSGRTQRRNINLSYVEGEDSKLMIELVNKAQGGFKNTAARKTQTNETTRIRAAQAADEFNALNKRPDERWQPEELLIMRNRMVSLGEKLKPLADKITEMSDNGVKPDAELLMQYEATRKEFIATQRLVSGKAAEAARLLQSLSITADGNKSSAYYKQLGEQLDKAGDKNIVDSAKAMSMAGDDLASLSAAAELTMWQKLGRFAIQARYNMMLSSVRTHVANMAGSTLTGLYEGALIKPVQSGFNTFEYIARKKLPLDDMPEDQRVRYAQEIPSQVGGAIEGTKKGIIMAKRITTGEALAGEGKVYDEMGVKYSPDDVPETLLGKAGTLPTRMLEAEDAIFRSVYFEMSIQQQAARMSRGGNVSFDSLVQNPTEEMIQAAGDYAKKMTFTSDPSIYGAMFGNLAKNMASMTNNHPLAKILVPFVNTPANVLGYTLETTGISQAIDIAKAPIDLYKLGRADNTTVNNNIINQIKGTPEERSDALARITVAAGMYYAMYNLWNEGKITGMGSGSVAVRRGMEAYGWQAGSLKVGDTYVNLNRADPLGSTLYMMASTFEAYHSTEQSKDQFNAIAAGVLSLADKLFDRSYISGVGDLFEILNEPTLGKISKLAVSSTASFIMPNVMRDFRNINDDYVRSLDTDDSTKGHYDKTIKYLKNAMPFMSEGVPPQIDANGNYRKIQGNAFYRGFVPFSLTKVDDTDVVSALYYYNKVPVNKPNHMIRSTYSPYKINLLALDDNKGWVYMEYQRAVGKARNKAVMNWYKGAWKFYTKRNQVGENSEATRELSKVVAQATRTARDIFLNDLLDKKEFQPMVDGKKIGKPIPLKKTITKDLLMELFAAKGAINKTVEQQKLEEQERQDNVFRLGKKQAQADKPKALEVPPM